MVPTQHSAATQLRPAQLCAAQPCRRWRSVALPAALSPTCSFAGEQQQAKRKPQLAALPAVRPGAPWLPQRSVRRQQRGVAPAAAAAATPTAAAAAASAFWPALVQAWNSNPAAVMLSAGACILGVSLSIFLLAAIPTMLALRRTSLAMESLLYTVQAEVPDTAATLRLSGMELADCIQEVGALSTDLTEGVRASARALASAESGLRQSADMAGKAVTGYVLPQARDKVESALQERARLGYTAAVAREMMQTTKSAVQRLRFALAATGLASGVANSARYLGKERGGRPDPREVPGA